MSTINTIIFDLGGVLIDWNPKYVYRKVFHGDEAKVDWFLNTICTYEWNEEHDAGRLIEDGNQLLIKKYPEHESLIRTYYERWTEMLGGPIPEGLEILNKLRAVNNHDLYALTNWGAETFPVALEKYDFLHYFKGIVVSGQEKTRKPFKKIYEIILDRYSLDPGRSVFIDDNLLNVEGARALGINAIQFKNSQQLTNELNHLGVHF